MKDQWTSISPATLSKQGHVEVGRSRGLRFKLGYEIHGEGPVKIVMIMGFLSSMYNWRPQIQYFGADKRFSVLVFDNRGFGHSETPMRWNSTDEMALDVIDLLQAVNWTEPRSVCLVGVSMGGMISLQLMLRIPERFFCTLLCSTAAKVIHPPQPFHTRALRWANMLNPFQSTDQRIENLLASLYPAEWLSQPPDTTLMANSSQMFSTNKEWITQDLQERIAVAGPTSIKALILQGLASLRHNVSMESLHKIGASNECIEAIVGTGDHLVDPICSEVLSHSLPCRLITFPGSGHALNYERRQEFNATLTELINEGLSKYVNSSSKL